MEHRFAVPAVTAHLSQRETYEQVLASLEALESASERVLGGIAARVESQRATLASIDARVASVNAKIAALAGTRRAITVLSLPRYPASEAGRDFRPLHHDARPLAATPADDRLRVVPRRTQAEHDAAEHEFRARRDGDAVELFRRFAALAQRREDPLGTPRASATTTRPPPHPPRAPRLETVARNVEKDTNGRVGAENTSFAPDDGLGAVPPGLASVSNLLLFNSATNPYARFRTSTSSPSETTRRTKNAHLRVGTLGTLNTPARTRVTPLSRRRPEACWRKRVSQRQRGGVRVQADAGGDAGRCVFRQSCRTSRWWRTYTGTARAPGEEGKEWEREREWTRPRP